MAVSEKIFVLTWAVAAAIPALALGTNDWVKAEASVELSSRKVFYGYALNREPIWIPHAEVSFFDAVAVGVTAYCDTTDWGKISRRGPTGYGDRSWRYQEIDPYVKLLHDFTDEEFSWLPTAVSLAVGYQYEYDPPLPNGDENPDSHYLTACVALPDLWLEPALSMEFDIDRDHGSYLNLDLGHSFPVIGTEEDAVLAIRGDVAQGWGDCDRIRAYSGLDERGLMDTMVRLTLEYRPLPWLKIAPYAAYYDFIFDRHVRDAARWVSHAGRRSTASYNFIGGVSVGVEF